MDFLFFKCMMCVHVYADTHTHMCACRGQRLALNVFFYCALSYFLRQDQLLNLELKISARLAWQQALSIYLSPFSLSVRFGHMLPSVAFMWILWI